MHSQANGEVPTKRNIEVLRAKTAEKVRLAYIHDEKIHGQSVRELVSASGHSLKAYLALLRWKLWASPLELCVAARLCGVDIMVATKTGVIKEGHRPRFIVKLMNQHYTLHAIHRGHQKETTMPRGRGGMRPQTWTWDNPEALAVTITSRPEPSESDDVPSWAREQQLQERLQEVEEETQETYNVYSVKVYVSPNVRTDVMLVELVLREGSTVAYLRARMAPILGISPERIRVLNEANEVLLHSTVVPSVVSIQDNLDRQTLAYDYMEIHMEGAMASPAFLMRVDQLWTHDQLVQAIANVINKHPSELFLADLRGNKWLYPRDRAAHMSIRVGTRDNGG